MTDEERFEAWLEKVCNRPLPGGELERGEHLARELAEGVNQGFWLRDFFATLGGLHSTSGKCDEYIRQKWGRIDTNTTFLLTSLGYMQSYAGNHFILTPSAFDLINKVIDLNTLHIGDSYTFISYARRDSDLVEQMLERLRDSDVNYWIDREKLTPGTPNWDQSIREAIKNSTVMILAATPNAAISSHVRDEISLADRNGVPWIPVLLEGEEIIDSVPLGYGSVQAIIATTNHFEHGMSELIRELRKLIPIRDRARVYICYRRSESTSLGLLVSSHLKQHGLDAFLDMALEPGEDWHAGLKERIQQHDYFVVLLGKETLESIYVRKEILWALEAKLIILPIWHNGFEYKPEDWPDLDREIDDVLRTRHTIRVVEENALAYDGALTELLNRFGVTPE